MDLNEILNRKLETLFQNEADRESVKQILEIPGIGLGGREHARVKLAVLKLAGDEPTHDDIEGYAKAAQQDYRDVLAWAEYPRQIEAGPIMDKEKNRELSTADKNEYETWLRT